MSDNFTKHRPCSGEHSTPFHGLPYLDPGPVQYPDAPDDEFCYSLWDKYEMLANVRAHSLMVAHIATCLALRARELGIEVDARAVRASGLLHDLAKTWSLDHGGSHAILGASWAMRETGHAGIAQGVILHVHWPWKLPQGTGICILPIFVMYADKRVRHDACVTLEERFEDLLARYGKTEKARAGIRNSLQLSMQVQDALSNILGWNLNEYTFDCGRLVHREGSFPEWSKEH